MGLGGRVALGSSSAWRGPAARAGQHDEQRACCASRRPPLTPTSALVAAQGSSTLDHRPCTRPMRAKASPRPADRLLTTARPLQAAPRHPYHPRQEHRHGAESLRWAAAGRSDWSGARAAAAGARQLLRSRPRGPHGAARVQREHPGGSGGTRNHTATSPPCAADGRVTADAGGLRPAGAAAGACAARASVGVGTAAAAARARGRSCAGRPGATAARRAAPAAAAGQRQQRGSARGRG